MRLVKEREGEIAEFKAKVKAAADEIIAEVETELAKRIPMPNNAPLPLPAGVSQTELAMFSRTDLDWVDKDMYSKPVASCSDNVPVLLRLLGVSVRFNAWIERVEISTDDAKTWATFTDAHFDWIMTQAANDEHRFRPAEGFMRRVLSTIAHGTTIDPALDRLAELEAAWDCTPRLATWLTEACGVPADAYHRLRPGCDHRRHGA